MSFDISILASAFEFAITLGEDFEVAAGEGSVATLESKGRRVR
jgi:hypothetical protein